MARRSFGSVRQRSSRRWEARYRDQRGEVHYRYFTTKAEATAHLAATEADMLRGDWLDPRLGRITVGEYADTFMASKREIRPRTRELYDCLIRRHIKPAFGNWQLAHVKPADVDAWMNSLAANPRLGPSTQAKLLRLLRQIMESAVRRRHITTNPCDEVERPKFRAGEMLFLNQSQVADLAEAIGAEHGWRAMVLLAAYGGLRWGECTGLTIPNVDPLRSRVRVMQQLHRDGSLGEPKSAKGVRTVLLPRWLSDELAAACALRSPAVDLPEHLQQIIFLTRDGTPLLHSSTWNRKVWRPAVVAALPPELHRLRFHDLRHTAVAIALDSARRAGQPLNAKALQERMGHHSITLTLDRYGHLMDGHDDEMVEAMTNPFANRASQIG